jgi:hypothetical protein
MAGVRDHHALFRGLKIALLFAGFLVIGGGLLSILTFTSLITIARYFGAVDRPPPTESVETFPVMPIGTAIVEGRVHETKRIGNEAVSKVLITRVYVGPATLVGTTFRVESRTKRRILRDFTFIRLLHDGEAAISIVRMRNGEIVPTVRSLGSITWPARMSDPDDYEGAKELAIAIRDAAAAAPLESLDKVRALVFSRSSIVANWATTWLADVITGAGDVAAFLREATKEDLSVGALVAIDEALWGFRSPNWVEDEQHIRIVERLVAFKSLTNLESRMLADHASWLAQRIEKNAPKQQGAFLRFVKIALMNSCAPVIYRGQIVSTLAVGARWEDDSEAWDLVCELIARSSEVEIRKSAVTVMAWFHLDAPRSERVASLIRETDDAALRQVLQAILDRHNDQEHPKRAQYTTHAMAGIELLEICDSVFCVGA